MKDLNEYIDSTLLRSDATKKDIEELCEEAVKYGFFSVCINPYNIPFAVPILEGTGVKICTVIGFPLGADLPGAKATVAKDACMLGASELDMVINIGALKNEDYDTVNQDILSVVHVGKFNGAITKVIIESALLTDEEIIKACEIAKDAGAEFIKTSTGYAKEGGASIHSVELIRKTVGTEMGIKASGGISTKEDAFNMITAGATRIGTSKALNLIK